MDRRGTLAFRNMPRATGRRTTLAVERKREAESTAMTDPHIKRVKRGVRMLASTVELAVMSTERATSAPAMRETRFEAVPPGEQPTRVSPRNRFGVRLNVLAERSAPRGMAENWVSTPNATMAGSEATLLKSDVVSVMPIPTMINPNAKVIVLGEEENQVREAGRTTPRTAEERTQKGKREVREERADERREGGGGGVGGFCVDVERRGCKEEWIKGEIERADGVFNDEEWHRGWCRCEGVREKGVDEVRRRANRTAPRCERCRMVNRRISLLVR